MRVMAIQQRQSTSNAARQAASGSANAYFLAKFCFDTAENEAAKNCKNLLIFPILLTLTPELALEVRGDAGGHRAQPRALEGPAGPRRAEGRPRRTDPSEVSIRHDHPVDGKMLLVFGCIGTDFCKKICVLQHFSKSTRLSS